MFTSPQETLGRIKDDLRHAHEREQKLPLLQSAIEKVRARAVSRCRDISVEVDSTGTIRHLDITDAALERGGQRVSQEVRELISSASRKARTRVIEVTTEIMGGSDPIVDIVAEELLPDPDERFDAAPRRAGRLR